MSFRFMPLALTLSVLVWAATALLSAAAECLSPPPSIAAGKDLYGPIATRELAPAQEQNLRQLLNSLAGRWHGTAQSFFCKSFDDPAEKELDTQSVEAAVEVDHYGNFFLTADLYSSRKKSGFQEMLRLYVNDHKLRFRYGTGAGDVELLEISADLVSFFYRTLVQTSAGGSSRREHYITLRRIVDGFMVERQLYIQGRLSSGDSWRFIK